VGCGAGGFQADYLKFNSLLLKKYHPRKGSSSKHHFSGVNSLLNFGGLFSLYSLANPLPSEPATTQDFSSWVT